MFPWKFGGPHSPECPASLQNHRIDIFMIPVDVRRVEIYPIYAFLGRNFRERRMNQFLAECQVTLKTRILDVGGAPGTWRGLPLCPRVVLLNRKTRPGSGLTVVRGDALALPFPDKSFDLVFCNSVIEHVASVENQSRMASEIRRVGVRYYVQTPNFWFPFEPHFLCPGFQYLPKKIRRSFAWRLTPWAWIAHPTAESARTMVNELRLLTRPQLTEMFPGARIRAERFLGLAKSFVVFGD